MIRDRVIGWLLILLAGLIGSGAVLVGFHLDNKREVERQVLDKRITGNALMSDQAFNEASKALDKAEKNELKIQYILERMKKQ